MRLFRYSISRMSRVRSADLHQMHRRARYSTSSRANSAGVMRPIRLRARATNASSSCHSGLLRAKKSLILESSRFMHGPVMNQDIQFETPENVRVSYRIAGPGTRFVAWFIDTILVWVVSIVIFIFVLIAIEKAGLTGGTGTTEAILVVFGVFYVGFALGAWFYFGLSELLIRGQTLGKRQMKIRVVKADGFSLDHSAVLLRTLFRVIDHLPPHVDRATADPEGTTTGRPRRRHHRRCRPPRGAGRFREELIARTTPSAIPFRCGRPQRARPQDVQAVERDLAGPRQARRQRPATVVGALWSDRWPLGSPSNVQTRPTG